MPALPAIANVLKLIMQFTAPAVADVITRLFVNGGGSQGTTAGLNTAAQTIANSWTTNIAPLTTSQQTLAAVSIEDLTSAGAPNGVWIGSKPGGAGSTFLAAPAVSFVMRNGIGVRSRGGHSRVYIPGIPLNNQSAVDSTQWNPTFITTLDAAWTTFLGNIVSAINSAGYGSGSMCVPHYYKGHSWNHTGTPPNDIYKRVNTVVSPPVGVSSYSLVSANPIIGSQRRRNHQTV